MKQLIAFGSLVVLMSLVQIYTPETKSPKPKEPETEINIGAIDLDLIDWDAEVYLEVTLTEEPNFAENDRIYLYKGDDFNIVIERVEPNEPKSEYLFTLDYTEADFYDEPNEPPPEED